jgi:hypothetical protein
MKAWFVQPVDAPLSPLIMAAIIHAAHSRA